MEENEERKLTRRELLGLAPGVVALALGVGAATGSTGPAGSSANVGPGTTNKLARFLSANSIGDSALTDDGSNISTSEDLLPSSDAARSLGSPSLRWLDNYLSRSVQVLAAVSDANPVLKLSSSGLQFGAGGASAVDVTLRRSSALSLQTDSRIIIMANLADANPVTNLRGQGLDFGAGGASAVDFRISRIAASRIGITDGTNEQFQIRADSNVPNIRFQPAGTLKGQINHDGSNFNVRATSGNLFLGDANIIPVNDNVQNYGTNSARWLSFVVSSNIARYAAAGDANPTFKISLAQLEFGAGGASALDVYLKRISAGLWETQAVRPQTDATYDFGTSSLRNRDIYASRRVIIAGKNALVLDGQSMTQSSHMVSNADTDIATYSLAANSYTHVIVRVTGYVSFATLSTNQVINLKLKDGTTQVGNTMVVDGAISATASVPFTIEAVFVETGAVTIHVTEGAAAADTATTVTINSIIVLGES